MKKSVRVLLGLVIGAMIGVIPVLVYVFKFSPCRDSFNSFDEIMAITFRSFYDQHYMLLMVGLGALIGAAIGLCAARAVPRPKLCFALLVVFIAGIVIGSTAIYRPGKNIVELMSAVWEDNAASERASAYLAALHAIDRGTTNQLYITRFQIEGRTALAGYLHETEGREERALDLKYKANMDFLFTNSATYHIVQKYLATHTNSLPMGSDF